jgi:hypothetical protein
MNHPPRNWPQLYMAGRPTAIDFEELMNQVDVELTAWLDRGKSAKHAAERIKRILRDVPENDYRKNRNPGT